MEKDWDSKKKALKAEAIEISIKEAKTIEKIFKNLLSRFPTNARYINKFADGILVSVIDCWKKKNNDPRPESIHTPESKDFAIKLFAVSIFLKTKIKVLKQVNGIKKFGTKKGF